jgi:glucose-1-phosphate thymidylyltransferase
MKIRGNQKMKGIILAGGLGTRLHPISKVISKQLLPIYDKPMIYYPLSTLMLAGIRDILIITTPEDNSLFINLLGDGSKLGLSIEYLIQEKPKGLPDAFVVGEKFIGDSNVCLILGDNIFHSDNFINNYIIPCLETYTPTVFGYYVKNPQRYGIVEFDEKRKLISIEEKPTLPKSNYAVTGLYFFDKNAPEIARNLKPSKRGETEISDMCNVYLKNNQLKLKILGRGVSWLDTGTHKSLHEASNYIEALQSRQGLKIACIEEIAYSKNYINKEELLALAEPMKKNDYGQYLIEIANQ